MPMGKCFTWEDHCAASWKNLTSFHSTPSMETAGGGTGRRQRAGGQRSDLETGAQNSVAQLRDWVLGRKRKSPLSMVCCCLAVQMRRLMPSITWLLDSTSLSLLFFGRNMTSGRGEEEEEASHTQTGKAFAKTYRPGSQPFVMSLRVRVVSPT